LRWRRERARGGQSPPPPAPPGSGGKIAASRFPQLIPSGFSGTGRRQRPCKARPRRASLRVAPACRERFGDLDATKNRAVCKLKAKISFLEFLERNHSATHWLFFKHKI